ncbi:MAG: alpha/beta hydrolase [Hydrogenothermaceae bacterium]
MKFIFIHGWGFSKNIWKDYFYLDNAIFLDLPSHGESKESYISLDNYVKKISSSITEPTTIVGWSVGSSIAVLIALQNPNIEKLILIGFSPKFNDEKFGSDPKTVKAFMYNLNRDFENTVFNFRKVAGERDFDCPLPEREGAIKLLKDYINLDLSDAIKDIKQKTFLIHGINDKIVNMNAALFCKEKIVNSEVVLLTSHHIPFIEWNIFELIGE